MLSVYGGTRTGENERREREKEAEGKREIRQRGENTRINQVTALRRSLTGMGVLTARNSIARPYVSFYFAVGSFTPNEIKLVPRAKEKIPRSFARARAQTPNFGLL